MAEIDTSAEAIDTGIGVEVAYALPDRQWLLALRVPRPCSALQAVLLSGLVESAGLQGELALGIFGQPCEPDTPLAEGDRVEVYRPLVFDPKESRRRRARKAKAA